MKTFVYKFKISDVIETYKKRIRESVDKDTEVYNYTTAVYEPPVEKKTDVKGRTVFVNLNALVNSLIKKDGIRTGYVVCASNHTTSGVYVNHFETGIMEDLNNYLNKEHPFTPAKYNDKGQALDEMGAQCSEFACPHCHHKLPPFFEQTTHHHITILGAPTAGKVYYQAALIHQLERELPRDFNIPFRDATPESNTALNNMRIRTFYSSTPEEFREGRDMMHHALRRKVWRNNVFELVPRPFIYNLTKESSAHSLLFYNTGNRESAQPVLPQIRKGEADAIFYLYDPTLEPAFREVIRDFATIPQQAPCSNTVCSQSQLLSVAEMHIRTALNVPPGEKINIPISVIVTKCDIWKQLLGPEPLLPIVRNGRLKPQNLLRNSLRIRDLLFHLAPEVCSQAESLSTRVNYFAVSSFGNPPEEFSDELTGETYIAPAGGRLSPFHVTDPVLWFLYNTDMGMFPEN